MKSVYKILSQQQLFNSQWLGPLMRRFNTIIATHTVARMLERMTLITMFRSAHSNT